jgi:MFS family permease
LLGALIVTVAVRQGPYAMPQSRFDPAQILEIVRNRPLRLANLGYLGHMWELYSMWGWIAVIFSISVGWSRSMFEAMAALAIAIGAVGCIWAGAASDRLQDQAASVRVAQRARVTIIAMAISSVCCVLAALVLHRPMILIPLSLIWGIAVIADSAQFSTIISEVSDKNYVGTALTCQVALGFLLTAFVIRLMAAIAARYGWNWALASMALGPVLGIWAMTGLLSRDHKTTA